jgi:hypothetical protein
MRMGVVIISEPIVGHYANAKEEADDHQANHHLQRAGYLVNALLQSSVPSIGCTCHMTTAPRIVQVVHA